MEEPEAFRAFVVEHDGDTAESGVRELTPADLGAGEVTVRVEWSGVNYKDGLAVSPTGRVARISPLVPGIDLAGTVVGSTAPEVRAGDPVLAHGYELGVSHHGGFAEYARVPAGWVVPLPDGLSPRQAMTLGTAGYTAALSVLALEERGLGPGDGPVLVLGATGGVGSAAVAILAVRGQEVWASTGKPERADWLRGLGAREVLTRAETAAPPERPLERARWAGCVDPVGGASLAYALRTLRPGAAVASSGLTGGTELHTTVLPFILRGVTLLGMDSVETPIARRRQVWARLADDLRPPAVDELATDEVSLDELSAVLAVATGGRAVGRTLVRIGAGG